MLILCSAFKMQFTFPKITTKDNCKVRIRRYIRTVIRVTVHRHCSLWLFLTQAEHQHIFNDQLKGYSGQKKLHSLTYGPVFLIKAVKFMNAIQIYPINHQQKGLACSRTPKERLQINWGSKQVSGYRFTFKLNFFFPSPFFIFLGCC